MNVEAWVQEQLGLRLSIREGDLVLTRQEGGRLVGVCVAALRAGKNHLAFVGVSERRRGVGRSLVEEAARRLGPLTTRFCDASVFPGVPEESAGFFSRLGFVATTRECTMRAPLGGFDPAEGVSLDEARLPRLRQLIADEFEPSWATILDEKLARGAWNEVLVSGDLSGFVIVSPAQPCSFFGPLGVAKSQRRRGLGRALTLQGLARVQQSGAPEVELWTDPDSFLGQSFYPKLGFKPVRIWQNFDYNK